MYSSAYFGICTEQVKRGRRRGRDVLSERDRQTEKEEGEREENKDEKEEKKRDYDS